MATLQSNLLAQKAPFLFSTLAKNPDWDRNQLAAIFAWCLENGGIEHPKLVRPAGAGFNPLPARLAAIFLQEWPNNATTAELATAMSLSVTNPEVSPPLPGSKEIRSRILNFTEEGFQLTPIESILWVIRTLDELRHLHLISNDCELHAALICDYKKGYSNLNKTNLSPRILRYFEGALTRWEPRLLSTPQANDG